MAVPFGSLAALYRDQGNYARAEEFSRRAVSLMSDEQRAVPAQRAQLLGMLGGILSARGKFGDAEAALQQSIDVAKGLPGPSEILAANWSNLAGVYARTGRLTEALAFYREAYAMDNELDPKNPNLFFILAGIASVEGTLGNYAEAVSSITSAIQRAEADGPANTLQMHDALLAEATWLHKLKREDEAKRVRAHAKRVAKLASQNSYSRYTVDARELENTIVRQAK